MRGIFLFTILVGLVIFSVPVIWKEKGKAQSLGDELVSFSPPSTDITLHEPLIITFTVNNSLGEPLTFDLGQHRKQNFRLTLTRPNGASTTAQNELREGISIPGTVKIQPGKSYNQPILVNEWFDISHLGKHTLLIEMVAPIRLQHGEIVSKNASARFTFNVLPRDTGVLNQVCQNFLNQILTSQSYTQASEATMALSHIRDSVAIPYLEQALQSNKVAEGIAIKGLSQIKGEESVRALIRLLDSENQVSANSARYYLHQLESEMKDPSLKQQINHALKKPN